VKRRKESVVSTFINACSFSYFTRTTFNIYIFQWIELHGNLKIEHVAYYTYLIRSWAFKLKECNKLLLFFTEKFKMQCMNMTRMHLQLTNGIFLLTLLAGGTFSARKFSLV
jgi:hypothetical protein